MIDPFSSSDIVEKTEKLIKLKKIKLIKTFKKLID